MTVSAIALSLLLAPLGTDTQEPQTSTLTTLQATAATDTAARLPWWRDARFGLFIHWGPVSLKGTEIGWSRAGERRGYRWGPGTQVPVEEYDNLYRAFNPVEFDAAEWVKLARDAGMKYVVFTSRHHDGFSMFDTAASAYRITSPESPFQRDVVKELADASHAADMRFGLYYSQPDWHHPDAFTADRHARYLSDLKAQLTELLSHYGRIDILWFDGLGKAAEDYDGAALIALARRLQPSILINDRCGLPEDFDTPEQKIGTFQLDRPWESCITICKQWAWKPNDELKSLAECVQTLVRCAGGDGNLLLNVGPMPDGRIEPRQQDRLREMGSWLHTHGESIYGTRGGPFPPCDAYATTRKGQDIFVHVFQWDADGVTLPPLPLNVQSASLLSGETVACEQSDRGVLLRLDETLREPIDTVVRLRLDGPASTIPPALAP